MSAKLREATRSCSSTPASTTTTSSRAVFFDELGVPAPDRQLDVGAGTNTDQTARMLAGARADPAPRRSPTLVLVYGDTNSTLAGALAAAQARDPVAHVEAGMRSFDRAMPEELNRVLADHASDLLLCSTETAVGTWSARGCAARSHLVGDVMADVRWRFRPSPSERSRASTPAASSRGGYLLATAHRAGNVDRPGAAARGSSSCSSALPRPVVFPVHPRTRARLEDGRAAGPARGRAGVELAQPLGYLDFLELRAHARAVLTDSGGVQKEAYLLGRALRDAARHHGVGGDGGGRLERARGPRCGRRAAPRWSARRPAERPELYGGGTPPSAFATWCRPTLLPMKIGIVGLGYVGLPLAVAFCEAGHEVTGVDADARVVDALVARDLACRGHAGSASPAMARSASTRPPATPTWPRSTRSIVAVPTPLTRNREPDLQPLIAAGTSLGRGAAAGPARGARVDHLPGHHARALVPMLEESGLARRPRLQRRLLARAHRSRAAPTTRCATRRRWSAGLTTTRSSARWRSTRRCATRSCRSPRPRSAELTKLLENVFRSVNIALVNELAILCDRMGMDIWEVVESAATKPYGFMSFKPGPGMGGHCLPGRPVLPGLAGARVRHAHRVHRAGRRGEPADALLLRGEDRARPERPREAGQGLAHRDPRRLLQGRGGRPARVARR